MNEPIRVLVTGVGGGSIGEQVCKALRCGRYNYEIVVTNTSMAPMSVFSAEYYEILPDAGSLSYIECLLLLIDKYKVKFLIPGSDPELRKISQCSEYFENKGINILINATSVIDKCLDKIKTFNFLESCGFRVPSTFEVHDIDDIDKIETVFPYIVKPVRGGGGSAAVFLAQDSSELKFFVEYLLKYGYQPLVQEYVGNAENEYTAGVLCYPDCSLVGSVVLHRNILSGLSNRLKVLNRTGREKLGNVLAISTGISQGTIRDFQYIKAQAEAIAQSLNSVGPLNIQGRWENKQFVPFEINPRFSGTTPMRAMAGFNEPELLIDWYLGQRHDNLPRLRFGEFTRGISEYFDES